MFTAWSMKKSTLREYVVFEINAEMEAWSSTL